MNLYDLEVFRDDLVHLRKFLIDEPNFNEDERIQDVVRELKWRIRDVDMQIESTKLGHGGY